MGILNPCSYNVGILNSILQKSVFTCPWHPLSYPVNSYFEITRILENIYKIISFKLFKEIILHKATFELIFQ